MSDIKSDVDRITQEMAEDADRRPHGKSQTCFNCIYWEITRHHRPMYEDDTQGECHRRAPILHHDYSATALGLIAWAVEATADIEHQANFDYANESEERPRMSWPRTYGSSWCGEFVQTEKPLRLELKK
jgi:hypothetical protein